MSPLNFGGLTEYLGPLTGGGMMNQQHRNAMAESEVNQNKGLEEILTAQQNRDIAKQKLPGELEMQQANITGKKVDNADKQSKLDREKYGYFLEDVIRFTPTDDPMADAFRLEETAKKAGLDPQDARVRFALTQAQNKEQLKALQQALTFNDPKHQQTMAKERFVQGQETGRTALQLESREREGAANRAKDLEIANLRKQQALEVAAAKAAAGKDAEGKKNYAQAFTAYVSAADAADAAGDSQSAQQLRARAQLMLEADAAVRGAAQNTPKAGGMQLPPGSGIEQRPPQPLPQVVPPQAAPQAPRQMTPQDQQALQWAKSNPQDPRARAILQKLGVQ